MAGVFGPPEPTYPIEPDESAYPTVPRQGRRPDAQDEPTNPGGPREPKYPGGLDESAYPGAPRERTYTVAFAEARLDGLFRAGGIERALAQSWQPGATYSRYGRRWYLSRILTSQRNVLVGRIGFIGRSLVSIVEFDVNVGDFVRGDATTGTIVPFAISTESGRIAYQLRSGAVAEGAFVGALAGLLNLNSREYLWRIEPLVENSAFDSWVGGIERVTDFHFRLERPNPHYHDDDLVEQIIEQFRLEHAILTGTARPGESVDVGSTAFRQALDHVLRGYGTASLGGLDRGGAESLWVRTKGILGAVLSRRKFKAFGSDEAPTGVLIDALGHSPAGAIPARLDDDDHEQAAS